MRTWLAALLVVACLAGCQKEHANRGSSTSSEAIPHVGLAADVLRSVSGGRGTALEAGQRIVMGTACASGNGCFSCFQCHGLRGEGSGVAQFPRLAGQERLYLVRTLQQYANGDRIDATMHEVAGAMTPQEIEEVSDYFAALTTPPLPVVIGEEQRRMAESLGKQIAEQGVTERGVPPCTSCHSAAARKALPGYPNLDGQYAGYLGLQLERFREEQRKGPEALIMQTVARGLTPEQSNAVANYYALIQPLPANVQ